MARAPTCPSRPPATIVHGDYRLGNTMVADDLPARLVAIFDWELATIGDPLADVGYLTITWVERDDPRTRCSARCRRSPGARASRPADELIALYEEASGRSVSNLRWYQTLALWKSAVFMEGNYKRSLAGTTDDPYLKLFDEGVPAARRGRLGGGERAGSQHVNGLLVDFGGVLTTNVFDSFRAFCVDRGPRSRRDQAALPRGPRGAPAGSRPRDRGGDRGRVRRALRRAARHRATRAGLVERMFSGSQPDEAMLAALRAARAAGIRTGLISNSMGAGRYDRDAFPELFDGVVISGDVGLHKPQPEIFRLGCERVGLEPEAVRVRGRPARELRGRRGRGHDRRAPPRRRDHRARARAAARAWSSR